MAVRPVYVPSLFANLLPAVVLNSVIALGITAFGEHDFSSNWVYSQCIGLSIGTLTLLGMRWLIADWDSQWRRITFIVPVAVVAGFLFGTGLADILLGTNSMAYWHTQPRKAWGFLALSLVAGAVLTYFSVSRTQLAKERERAEAAQRHAAESRLRLLESQLEPHMLFNTLANLRALISADPARAQTMLDHLIAYLRATLSASRANTHTLEQEFARLHDYLELMAVRMGPRLQYTLHLPDALRNASVPPLLLQPLVENSIQHGLEPQVQGGTVTVRATAASGLLSLEVVDTGKGMNSAGSTAEGKGFGLRQVRERLVTLYGSESAIEFVANPAGGTRACISIPFKP
jgi:signal transduction histidine kinase